jgi:hypothetical protein
MFRLNTWQIRAILSIVIAYCTWGLWDTLSWVTWNPGKQFPMPFNIVYLDPWIAGDFFVTIIAFCLVYMFVIQRR